MICAPTPSRTPSRTRAMLLLGLLISLLSLAPSAAASAAAPSPWVSLPYPSTLNPGAMLLLTDGSVMVQDQGPENSGAPGWWLLTPNAKGSYAKGTWKQIASLPSGYGPVSFASAVLPDGRVIIEGGEDNLGDDDAFTDQGAIYDPVTNNWTSVAPPSGPEWSTIGDAPSTVLPDGTFMLGGSGNYTNRTQALLNPASLTWTVTGTGKVDNNEESGFTLLPNGEVLTVGVTPTPDYAETYDPSSGAWSGVGTTPTPVVDVTSGEIGPQPLLPNGTVLVVGASGPNAVYNVATQTWSAAPSLPVIDGQQYDCADAPAAVLPDGNVLIDASPGVYQAPSHFFVYNGSTFAQVADPPNAASLHSTFGYMLVLPTGQILFNDRFGQIELYNGGGSPEPSWRPVVQSVPRKLTPGHTYSMAGLQLNGLTQGSYYGDDYQDATNYPLVRLTYKRPDRVTYARTFNMSSMAVTPMLASTVQFELPAHLRRGKAELTVVANGIASKPVAVTVR